jgi:hypothetical protein
MHFSPFSVKVNLQLSLSMPQRQTREEEVQIHSFLIALLDGMSGQLLPTAAHSLTKALK